MKHTASKRFWQCLDALPIEIQSLARRNFLLLKSDPRHPSLHFKSVGDGKFHSVRVGLYYRHSACQLLKAFTGSGSERTASTTKSLANRLLNFAHA